jgi:chitin synthase
MMPLGTESYVPPRNIDKKALLKKEALPGEIHEGEVVEVLKETSARRRWIALCWLLTWRVPPLFLRWSGCMKCMDMWQAWREKLVLNMIIWLFCACAVFVFDISGNPICPAEHAFSTNELAPHRVENHPNNAYVAICREVFDLATGQVTDSQQYYSSMVQSRVVLFGRK